jgi:arylsulfatase A-like enzyme
MDRGFHHYEGVFNDTGVPYGGADQVAARTLRYLRGLDWEQPVFLYVHFMDTHGPYRKPEPDLLAPDDESLAGYYTRFQEWESLHDVEKADHESDLRHMMAAYDTSVRFADRYLGQVLRFYEDRGLAEQTIFFVTADHGDEFLEHGGTTHKGTLFEELIHVPLVVRVPGGRGGLRIREVVRNFDITPTILDYAGLGGDTAHMDARSLRAMIEGESPGDARTVYASFPHLRMMRTDRFKLLRHSDGRESLFDIVADPGETRDLNGSGYEGDAAREHLPALRALLDETVRRLEAQGATGDEREDQGGVDDATREQLRKLGYLE